MQNAIKRRFIGLTAIIMALTTPLHAALQSTAGQLPIQISAGTLTYHSDANTMLYSEDVVLQQGFLHIMASRLKIITDNEQIVLIQATGTPTRFRHQQSADDKQVAGRAQSIVYDPQKNILAFAGNALLKQEGRSIRGHRILYNIHTQVTIAESADGEQGDVQAVLHPETLEQNP